MPKGAIADADAVQPSPAPRSTEAELVAARATVGTKTWGGLPDLAWCRRNIPLGEVLDSFEIKRRGRAVCCPWHDDVTPSASVFRNRLVCHAGGCEIRASVLDVVIFMLTGHREFSDKRGRRAAIKAAISWLQVRYTIPALDPAKHQRWRPGRALVGGYPTDVLVRGGLYSKLPRSAGDFLQFLAAFADPLTGEGSMSYRVAHRLGRFRPNPMSEAIALCRGVGVLDWSCGRRSGGVPSTFKLYLDACRCADAIVALPGALKVLAIEKAEKAAKKLRKSLSKNRSENRTSTYGSIVRFEASTLGGNTVLPRYSSSSPADGKKNEPAFRRGDDEGGEAPNAQKGAPAAVEKTPAQGGRERSPAPAAGGRRRRRERHPGFGDWRRLP